ncbi:MAG TPA: class I SAM-dependent methyltransferase [Vicinamibacterales bacterium]|jgi:SAM-dependent methyltransferase|nr:class I SAM-dependent methyltransferase [Vicinamibacterales bacterium]
MRSRFIPLFVLFALASLLAGVAGTRLFTTRPTPPIHPLTGRQIAGIATDTNWLDRPAREQEEEPDRALDLIGISPGMAVADIGAGTGYMSIRLARRVGQTGKVYANDLQPRMLRLIQDKARAQQLSNVEIVQGSESDARLPEDAIDLALLVDVYHEFSRPREMLRSIRRSLKPNGQLVLVEYRKEDPSIPIADTHRMSVADARTEIEAEGFTFDRLVTGLPRQHIVKFRR